MFKVTGFYEEVHRKIPLPMRINSTPQAHIESTKLYMKDPLMLLEWCRDHPTT